MKYVGDVTYTYDQQRVAARAEGETALTRVVLELSALWAFPSILRDVHPTRPRHQRARGGTDSCSSRRRATPRCESLTGGWVVHSASRALSINSASLAKGGTRRSAYVRLNARPARPVPAPVSLGKGTAASPNQCQTNGTARARYITRINAVLRIAASPCECIDWGPDWLPHQAPGHKVQQPMESGPLEFGPRRVL